MKVVARCCPETFADPRQSCGRQLLRQLEGQYWLSCPSCQPCSESGLVVSSSIILDFECKVCFKLCRLAEGEVDDGFHEEQE